MSKSKILNTPIRSYETIYVVRPDLNDFSIMEMTRSFEKILFDVGGKKIFSYNQGRRRLTYKIKDWQDGVYINLNFVGNGSLVKKLEQELKINEQVLRFLTTSF